jgi:hypothetical protein
MEAVVHFLEKEKWLGLGVIIFSQYYDTAKWLADYEPIVPEGWEIKPEGDGRWFIGSRPFLPERIEELADLYAALSYAHRHNRRPIHASDLKAARDPAADGEAPELPELLALSLSLGHMCLDLR